MVATVDEHKMRHLDGEQRKQKIVRSAVRAFSEWGFRGSTTRRLARGAGISEALLYRYFENKEDLFRAVLGYLLESFRLSFPEAPDGPGDEADDRAFFLEVGEETEKHFLKHPEELRILLHAALEHHGLAEQYFERQYRPIYDAVIARIRRGQREGRYRMVSPRGAARSFIGMINYSVLIRVLFEDRVLPDSERGDASLFADVFLNGISHDKS